MEGKWGKRTEREGRMGGVGKGIYRLFRPGRWSRGLHVPRSAPLDPYFHFLVDGRCRAD